MSEFLRTLYRRYWRWKIKVLNPSANQYTVEGRDPGSVSHPTIKYPHLRVQFKALPNPLQLHFAVYQALCFENVPTEVKREFLNESLGKGTYEQLIKTCFQWVRCNHTPYDVITFNRKHFKTSWWDLLTLRERNEAAS